MLSAAGSIEEMPNAQEDNSAGGSPRESERLKMPEISKMLEHITKADPQQSAQMQLPPLDFYKPKVNVRHECINYGLNMYFKKPCRFSADPDQGGGAGEVSGL